MKETWCRLCMEDITKGQTIFDFLHQDALLCGHCHSQLDVLNRTTYLDGMPLHMVYRYNDFMENMIFQYKEGHDTALRDVFFYDIRKELHKKFRRYTIVLMPSSEEKTKERGFLPVREMLRECRLHMIEPFYKSKDIKQSLQTYENRVNISQVIRRRPELQLPNQKLLLVDDVCTSGNTLKCAYHLLQEHTYKIEALALCVHPRFLESCVKRDLKRKGIFTIL